MQDQRMGHPTIFYLVQNHACHFYEDIFNLQLQVKTLMKPNLLGDWSFHGFVFSEPNSLHVGSLKWKPNLSAYSNILYMGCDMHTHVEPLKTDVLLE